MGEELLDEVERVFAGRANPTPHWPDPHPDREVADEEYSRCLLPAKYRIVKERADAWITALTTAGLATAEEIDPRALPSSEPWLRITRLNPTAPGAIPLLLARRGFEGVDDNLVGVAAGDPPVRLTTAPDCGCDACDSGSQDLIHMVDDAVRTVLAGGVLHVVHNGRKVTRKLDGWSATGNLSQRKVKAWLAGNVPRGATVTAGAPWR